MAEILLKNGDRALVDEEDLSRLALHTWGISKNSAGRDYHYPARYERPPGGKLKKVLLHREIMNAPKGMEVDHINHDPLDNRRANLRLVTHQQNMLNKKLPSNNKTGYKGVYWDKDRGKYRVQIRCGAVKYELGRTTSLEEAARLYDDKAHELFGEYYNPLAISQ